MGFVPEDELRLLDCLLSPVLRGSWETLVQCRHHLRRTELLLHSELQVSCDPEASIQTHLSCLLSCLLGQQTCRSHGRQQGQHSLTTPERDMSTFCLLPVWLWRGHLCQRGEANSQAGTALIRSPFEAEALHFITCVTLQLGQALSTGWAANTRQLQVPAEPGSSLCSVLHLSVSSSWRSCASVNVVPSRRVRQCNQIS